MAIWMKEKLTPILKQETRKIVGPCTLSVRKTPDFECHIFTKKQSRTCPVPVRQLTLLKHLVYGSLLPSQLDLITTQATDELNEAIITSKHHTERTNKIVLFYLCPYDRNK